MPDSARQRPPAPPPAPSASDDARALEALARAKERLVEQLRRRIVGQARVIDLLLTCLFAGGHGLFVGVPGLAKTLLVSSLAEGLELEFSRVQFTPDLMPADITGSEVLEEVPGTGRRELRFVPGPVFCNLLLADEINRTPPKTQAALLQAMQEARVSAGGQTRSLPQPFHVFATQNPIEQEGTYPLPEAQLDRFLFKVLVDYPEADVERRVYEMLNQTEEPELSEVTTGEEILAMQRFVKGIPTSSLCVDYALRIMRATRASNPEAPAFVKDWVLVGAGPRGGQAILTAAKTRAALDGRPEVDIEDMRAVAAPVLRHRLILSYAAEAAGETPDSLVARLLREVPVQSGSEEHGERVASVSVS